MKIYDRPLITTKHEKDMPAVVGGLFCFYMAELERKTFPVFRMKTLDEQGVLEAIVSVTGNVDSGREIVMPGFFSKSLERKFPKGVWAHDWAMPIAKTLEAEEWKAGDPRLPDELKALGGYYIKGQFNLETQRGREAYSDIKFGIVDEFSIGYSVKKDQLNKEKGARELVEGEWFEWSPVLVGMNRETQLLSVKGSTTITTSEGVKVKSKDAPDVKGMFEEQLQERTNSLYNLFDVLCFVLYQVEYLQSSLEQAGTAFDASAAVDEALSEFSARVRARFTEEEPMAGELAYAGLSKSTEGGLGSELPLEKHSETVGSAVQEFARRGDVLTKSVERLVKRISEKQEIRVKEGRTLSAATLEKMSNTRKALQDACDHLDGLMNSSVVVEKSEMADPQEALNLYARVIELTTAYAV